MTTGTFLLFPLINCLWGRLTLKKEPDSPCRHYWVTLFRYLISAYFSYKDYRNNRPNVSRRETLQSAARQLAAATTTLASDVLEVHIIYLVFFNEFSFFAFFGNSCAKPISLHGQIAYHSIWNHPHLQIWLPSWQGYSTDGYTTDGYTTDGGYTTEGYTTEGYTTDGYTTEGYTTETEEVIRREKYERRETIREKKRYRTSMKIFAEDLCLATAGLTSTMLEVELLFKKY